MSLLEKASIITTPTAYGVGVLNSIKPAIPFGEELISNGDFSNGSTGWTIINGTVTDKYNASMTAYQSGIRITPFSYTGTFKVVFDLVITSGNCKFDAGGGNDEIYTTSGTKEKIITNPTKFEFNAFNLGWVGTLDNVSVKEMIDADFDFTRTSSAVRVAPNYLIETSATNTPRLDYTNGTASILLENQSTNLLTYSNDFSQSVWNKQSGVTATYNTTETLSPDGTYNATKLIGNGTTGIFTSLSVSGVVSRSIYIKSVTGNVNVILKDPVSTVTQKTLNVTTQWQRFELVEDNTTSIQGIWVDDIPSSGIYIYGAQIESQSYTTSYIPTSGSTVTRAAETLNNAGNSDLINSTEGTLYADISALANDGTNRAISISDGTTSNVVRFYYSTTDNRIVGNVKSGGLSVFTFNNVLSNAVDFIKLAIKYKANDFKMYVNGIEVSTDTSGAAPVGLKELAFDNGAGSADFYGRCKTVAVFKEALSDTELACLTSTNNREIFLNYYYRMQYVGANTEALSCAEKTFNI